MTGPKLVPSVEETWVQQTLPFDTEYLGRPAILDTRENDYGDVRVNHERIAALWSAYLGYPINAHQVAICMALVKLSRLRNSPTHQDSYDDLEGYLHIAMTLAG